MDEPTNGLDPNGIVEMRHILRSLAEKENMAIIISSHNLAELEQMCDVIGLINNGKIIEHKTMQEIDSLLQNNQQIQSKPQLRSYSWIKSWWYKWKLC